MNSIKKIYLLTFLLSISGLVWHYVWMSGDGWWYLALGREIFFCKCLPEHNYLAFTGHWSNVLHQQWLPYLIFYSSYLHGGYFAVYAITTLFIASSFLATFYTCGIRNSGFVTPCLTILMGALAFRSNFSVRSEPLIYLLFSTEVLIISQWFRGNPKTLFLLPILTLIWANAHSSLPLALVYLALAFVSSYMDKKIGHDYTSRQKKFNHKGKLFLWGVTAFLLTFLNPYTYKIYLDIYERLTSESLNLIEIFVSPDFRNPDALLQGIWLLLLWVGIIKSPTRVRIFDLTVAGAMSILFLNSQRYFIFTVLACSPIMAKHWGATVHKLLRREAFNFLVACVCLTLGIGLMITPRHYKNIEINVARASDKLMKSGFNGNVFNYYTWGGLLLWYQPQMKIFIDGRNNIYEKSGVFDDYRKVQQTDPEWEDILNIYNIEAIFIPPWESRIYSELDGSERWKKVIREGEAVVFARAELLEPKTQ